MNCPEASLRLPDLVYDTLPAADRAALEAHLAGCPRCRAEAAALGQVRQLLAADPAPPVQVDVPALYREAGRRQARALRRTRFLAAVSVAALALVSLALVLRLEITLQPGAVVVRWGPAPLQKPIAPPAPEREQVKVRPLPTEGPGRAEQLKLLSELVQALADDARARDYQHQRDVAGLQAQIDNLQRQAGRWSAAERDIAAIYSVQFPNRKGPLP